jgi:hypothetical protein
MVEQPSISHPLRREFRVIYRSLCRRAPMVGRGHAKPSTRPINTPVLDKKKANQQAAQQSPEPSAQSSNVYSKYAALNVRPATPVTPRDKSFANPTAKHEDAGSNAARVAPPPVVAQSGITPGSHENSEQSFAQVATMVGPRDVAPPKSCGLKPNRERASPIKVRLSDAERELVRRKAAHANLSVNAFIKASILGADYKPPLDPGLRRVLLKLNLELTRQGTNLNQIARQMNAGLVSILQGETMLETLGRSLLRTHQYIRKALAHDAPEPEP